MKFKNWLVYSFTKNGLIILSVIVMAFGVMELVSVLSGYTPAMHYQNSLRITWEADPVAPGSLNKRLVFMLPSVIVLAIASWCLLQIAMLLKNIRRQTAFREKNFRRLSNIGLAILFTNLLLLFFAILQMPLVSGSHDQINKALITDQPGFSLIWVLVGGICMALAHAFQNGTEIQTQLDSYI
jgi:hypothetical protein